MFICWTKQIMNSINKLNDVDFLIQHAPYAVVSMDESHRITIFNPVAEELFGYSKDEIIGERIERLMPKEHGAGHHQHVEKFQKSKEERKSLNSRNVIYGRRKDDSLFPIRAGISKMHLDQGMQFLAFIEDYSEKAKMEEELKHTFDQLYEKNKEITESIQYAWRLQKAIFPRDKFVAKCFPDSYVLFKPKDIVAGDFYWMKQVKDHIVFAVADCTGHGVPGSMVSIVCNNALNRVVVEQGIIDPGLVLNVVRDLIITEFEKSEEEVKDGMDVSFCTFNPETNILKYSGANNPAWLLRKDSDQIEILEPLKQPVGKFENPLYFTTTQVKVTSGDRLYLFSDGYADQFGGEGTKPHGKKFKSSNFKKLLIATRELSMEEQKSRIDATIEEWRGSMEQIDDICVMGINF